MRTIISKAARLRRLFIYYACCQSHRRGDIAHAHMGGRASGAHGENSNKLISIICHAHAMCERVRAISLGRPGRAGVWACWLSESCASLRCHRRWGAWFGIPIQERESARADSVAEKRLYRTAQIGRVRAEWSVFFCVACEKKLCFVCSLGTQWIAHCVFIFFCLCRTAQSCHIIVHIINCT